MTRRVMALVVILLVAGVALAAAQRGKVRDLPTQWRIWLEEEVYPLINDEQRKAFLALETEAQRAEFAERLWLIWGQTSGHGGAFRRLYDERLDLARMEFENTLEDRARVLLLHGPPELRKQVDCENIFHPLEFWMWSYLPGLGQEVTVVFYKPYGLGRFRLWDPMMENREALYTYPGRVELARPRIYQFDRPEYRCVDGEVILRLLARAEYWMNDLKSRSAMQQMLPPPDDGREGAESRFLQFTTLVPEGSQPLPFDVQADVGGRRGSKVRVTFQATLPRGKLRVVPVGDVQVVQVDVVGEVAREGTMVDRFRYAFTFPAEGDVVPVVVEREVWPGSYTLRLKVADVNSSLAGSREVAFEVTVPPVEAAPVDTAGEQAVEQVASGQEPVLALIGSPPWLAAGWRKWSSSWTIVRSCPRTPRLSRSVWTWGLFPGWPR